MRWKQKNWKMSIQSLHLFDHSSFNFVRRLSEWFVNSSVNYVRYEITFLLTLVNCHSIETSSRSSHVTFYSFFDFVIRFVQQHVNEKTKNKNITKNKNDEYKSKNRNLLMQKMSTRSFYHLFLDFQSDQRWFTSHVFWKIEINEFATASNALVFFAQFWQMQFQKQWLFYTISHYVMLQCERLYLFSKRSNSKFSEFTHARESFSRQFSISMHVFRFSKIFHSTSICKRCQKHFVIYLFSDWFTSIVSKIEKISFWKYWFEEVTKIVCFSNFSFVEEVLDRVYLLFQFFSLVLSFI